MNKIPPVKSVTFVKSSTNLEQCPTEKRNEFAFIGRSNVGKSSLINMLMQRNKLAKISSTPGKTRTINHFIVNDDWFLVDLPGYGYAKRSKSERSTFSQMIQDYVLKHERLLLLFVLIDLRLPPQKADLEFFNLCGEKQIPFHIVFTKYDKVKASQREKNLKNYLDKLLDTWAEIPPYYVTSSKTGLGRDEIMQDINKLNSDLPVKKF
ncbi:MAG: ribosome biogenesis GTP-binding protein YihA/YsxC [Bacteroidota bacterium]|nr:ribosome biogenesis GTP-binding protein YihA/YsxC [Bacteroidota bacterium]